MGYLVKCSPEIKRRQTEEQVGQWVEIALALSGLIKTLGFFGQKHWTDVRDEIYGACIAAGIPRWLVDKKDVENAMEWTKSSEWRKKWIERGYTEMSQYKKGILLTTYWVFFSEKVLAKSVEAKAKGFCEKEGGTWTAMGCIKDALLPPPVDKASCEVAGMYWTGTECIDKKPWIEAGMMKNLIWFMVIGSVVSGGYLLYEKYKKPKALEG